MITLKYLWEKLTNTEALEKSSKLETTFFETVYRVVYVTGLSTAEGGVPYLIYSTTIKLTIALLISGEIWFAFTECLSLDEFAAGIIVIVMQFIAMYRIGFSTLGGKWASECSVHHDGNSQLAFNYPVWDIVLMVIHKDLCRKMARSMESSNFDISTAGRRKLVDYWSNKNNNYLKLLLFLGNITLAAWFLYPLIDDIEYNMFIGIRLPIHYRSPILYPFTYLATFVAFVYTSYFVMITVLIMQAHLLHLVCQLSVLSDCFENITTECKAKFKGKAWDLTLRNKEFQELYKKRLADLVDQHRTILCHIMELRGTLSGPMLGQLTGSGILICFISYQVATTGVDNVTKILMSLFFLCYNLFEIYVICRWGDEITVQSQKVGEAVYCSHWESGLSKIPGVKSCLVLVIARSNKPLVLSAGGMYNLSLESYTSLVKTSYSAFTVLLRFR